MQIIQGIRDKVMVIVIALIALSLIGFLLMSAKEGSNSLFSSNSTTVGSVDGTAIEMDEFEKKVALADESQTQQNRGQSMPGQNDAVRDQVWNQMVVADIIYKESKNLGMEFTSKEISDLLSSDDPSNPLMQDKGAIDPTTGKLKPGSPAAAMKNIKSSSGAQRENIKNRLIEPEILSSAYTKYLALLNASVYYPDWMKKKDSLESSSYATISYVQIPYDIITDSSIKVTDADVDTYVKKHAALFKQDAGRMASYVTFSQLPNAADTLATKIAVDSLKNGFVNATNVEAFLARNISVTPYDSNYIPKSRLGVAGDSISRLSVGEVYGPYFDQGNFSLAKLLGEKSYPDSVKARHILIAVNESVNDSIAHQMADSILQAVKGGADFGLLALKYSADKTSAIKGGDLGTFGYGMMVPEFNDFCFNKPVGEKAVVKTQFGYHVIEKESEKGSSPTYKIAFMSKHIDASETTINEANQEAIKLSAQKTSKNFDDYVTKNKLQKKPVTTLLKENDYRVDEFQDGRQFVKWVFGAKEGDVSEPLSIGDQYVVVTLDKIVDEGLQDAKVARAAAETKIRIQKKADAILAKLGASPTVESAAKTFNKEVTNAGMDSSLTYAGAKFTLGNIAQEPKCIGACFNKANLGKATEPIVGKMGVYVIKVNSYGTKPSAAINLESVKATMRNNAASGWVEGLKSQAKIKDNRAKFF